MKQLLILSGKGGTGKTTVSSAFIEMSRAKAFADCDVDAPNLHLVLSQASSPRTTDYYGLGKAFIDPEKCTSCGLCEKHCNFGAIKDLVVGEFECEGCGVCVEICPTQAISMQDYVAGNMMLYRQPQQVFSTAQLKMGSGSSGKLVTAVKQQLRDEAEYAELSIIDGSPGIGCPVIASISGVDFVLIVAEPTLSGIHDMKRIIETAKRFGVKCAVCINKYDVNVDMANEIEQYCSSIAVTILGKIPYDKTVLEAVNACKTMAQYPDSKAGKAIALLWEAINEYFEGETFDENSSCM